LAVSWLRPFAVPFVFSLDGVNAKASFERVTDAACEAGLYVNVSVRSFAVPDRFVVSEASRETGS
jgi:hypothetical protein